LPLRNGLTLTRPGLASKAWVDETVLGREFGGATLEPVPESAN
jgi:hypothetical protein